MLLNQNSIQHLVPRVFLFDKSDRESDKQVNVDGQQKNCERNDDEF